MKQQIFQGSCLAFRDTRIIITEIMHQPQGNADFIHNLIISATLILHTQIFCRYPADILHSLVFRCICSSAQTCSDQSTTPGSTVRSLPDLLHAAEPPAETAKRHSDPSWNDWRAYRQVQSCVEVSMSAFMTWFVIYSGLRRLQ